MAIKFPDDTDRVTVAATDFTFQDIKTVVERFYGEIQNDPILSVPFQSVKNWPEHIVRLQHFWWIRFGGQPYLPVSYNPVEKHYLAGFNEEFLVRWLRIFKETHNKVLRPEQAKVWGLVAERMGGALTAKNEMYREALRAAENE